MDHQRAARHEASDDVRLATDILADARDLRASHAARLFAAATSWVRQRLAPRVGQPRNAVPRRLVVH